jgi:ankyrin repeat protein
VSAISRENITRFFFTRISHLKTIKKLDLMKADLNNYPWLVNLRNAFGSTPLMHIAERPFAYKGASVDACTIAEVLIGAGADVNAQDTNGKTALNRAVAAGNVEMIHLLLKENARVDLIDKDRRTALHGVCMTKHNDTAVVKALLSSASTALIDRRDRNGKNALHMAIANGNVDLVKTLLDAGADPEKRTGSWKSPKSLARGARISDEATNQIIELLQNAKTAKKMPH